MTDKKYKLDKNRKRVKYCPCGKSNRNLKFAPFIGYEKKGYCHSCEKTFWPEKEYNYVVNIPTYSLPPSNNLLDRSLLEKYGRNFKENNFIQFLVSKFPPSEIKKAISKYCLGTSDYWQGAIIFWQIDLDQNIRHGKVMQYDPTTGKRAKNKSGYPMIHSMRSILKLNDFNLKQCLFGLHILNESSSKKVAIVEGEKTAVIMSIYKPEYTWMATGSRQGFKYDFLKELRGYEIVAFPDKGEYDYWSDRAIELQELGFHISVSDWLETLCDYDKGTDLADVLLDNDITLTNNKVKPEKNEEINITEDELIPTNLERNVNKLGERNRNIWLLIEQFDLTDEEENDIRKLQ